MNCTLTLKQQKLLFGKVTIDLSRIKSFNFDMYSKDFHDIILNKTGDRVLAANYVGLLPMNIRALMGIDKAVFRKLALNAGRIADLEAQFEDFNKVQDYVNSFYSTVTDMVNLEKIIQEDSLTKPPQQETIETPENFKPIENVVLSDIPFDNTRDNYLKPEMRIYADAKAQLIKNVKPDGSTSIESLPVRLSIVSTEDFKLTDQYPDTQSKILSGDEKAIKGQKEGVVLAITDLKGIPIRFSETLKKDDNGKIIFYNMRNPVNDPTIKDLDDNDRNLTDRIEKEQKVTKEIAQSAVLKQLQLIKNIRTYINKYPKTKIAVNLNGGTINYQPSVKKSNTPVAALNLDGNAFKPYKGIKAKGQLENVYYFDVPGTNITSPINGKAIPQDLVDKLSQLIAEDLSVKQGSKVSPYANQEKIKLFNQFIYINKDAFDLSVDERGDLVVKKLGIIQNYIDKQALAKDISDILTRRIPIDKIGENEAKKMVKANELKTALFGQYIEQILPDGTINRYKIGIAQLKINDTAFKNNLYNDFTINNGIITIERKYYYDFIQNNFNIPYALDSQGHLQTTGSTLDFSVSPEGILNVIENNNPVSVEITKNTDHKNTGLESVPVERELSIEEQMEQFLQTTPDVFNKIIGQSNLESTLDQLGKAKLWYEKHPLSTYFPFKEAFNLVNQRDSNSIAAWTISGITLYKGADYSDLYHEAWHGFTQGLLTKENKKSLYNEVRKYTGTFKDYSGSSVQFKDASDLQLEEFLAEDFREYVLSDGKKILKNTPKRNNIFRKILNFLKQLFGNTIVKDSVTNEEITNTISELYRKLKIGDISEYTFADENRNFNTLNKALQSINKEDLNNDLNFQNSNLLFNTVESLFSEYADNLNKRNTNNIEKRRVLQAKSNLTLDEKTELEKLNAQITSGYTTVLFSKLSGVKSSYQYAKLALELKLKQLKVKNETTPSTLLQQKIDLLSYGLRNFGNVDKLYLNKPNNGIIGYHLYKSNLIQEEVFDEFQVLAKLDAEISDDAELVGRELEGKEFFDRGGNESSIFDLANREIRNLIKGLNKTDSNGVVISNNLGFPELVDYKQAFAYIARVVQNSKDRTEMYERLQNESKNFIPIKQLLDKMGPLSYIGQTDREVMLWNKFYQTFNKYRIPLNQTTINEEEQFKKVRDEFGNEERIQTSSKFDVRIGNSLADYKKIDQDWRATFAKNSDNIFIKNDNKGNYLDIKSLLETYPNADIINNTPIQFLRDIGINLSDIKVIKDELISQVKSGSIRLSGIYNNLSKLNELGITVRGIGQYLNHNREQGIIGQTGPKSNYGKILAIQSRYSGEYSDFMVQNAAGDPQSEFSQNNSLTQLVKHINTVNSYNELVANPATSHYNNSKNTPGRPYNPFINSSIWIKSLFDMQSNEGPKYNNQIVIENLSGINSSINDGVFQEGMAASQADEVGKLLNDFHIQLMKFTPELTRHAGKKTSLAVSLLDYKTGSRNSRLYIDTENFVVDNNGYVQGISDFYDIVSNYITAELDRVNYAKYLLTDEVDVKQYDFNYLRRASEFSAFSGILSGETKNKLYDFKGDWKSDNSLSDQVFDNVAEYLQKLIEGVTDKMNQYDFISPTLIDKITTDAKKIGKNVNSDNIRKGLIASFVANNWIHHFEEMIMLYGDIALYKDFFKRNASLNSTGDIIPSDPEFISYVNNTLGKPFSKKSGASSNTLTYDSIWNTSISADVLTKSVYLEEYKKAVNSPTIESKYGKDGVNEADAQGLIAFDVYRIVLKGLGKWNDEQEQAFQEILSGKHISELDFKYFFPVLKMGYFGPLQTEYLPLTALHKFALLPLIPGLSENLDNLHNKMMQEGISYHTFESGSKVATVTDKSGLQPFYSDLENRTLNPAPFVKNRIFSDYLKYQVESAPYYKGKMTLPTQLRKLAIIGLTDRGIPTDYKGTKKSWEALNEIQKKSESLNYKLERNFAKSIQNLVDHKKKEFLNDIGWNQDEKGSLNGELGPLLRLISDELKRSDVGEHEWNYIQTIKGKDVKNSLDISQSANIIEKIITSLVNKRLVDLKIKGEQLVMVSTTGFENKTFAYSTERNFNNPSSEDLKKYGTNDLPTYHIGGNGLIMAAKVKIALQGDFKKLLELEDVVTRANELGISKFQALNLLIRDDSWVNEGDNRYFITMVGARIPTQGPNSAEFVEVYEFLPEIAGNIIVAPSEVTSKGGSDFDYDKLPLMMPNIRVMDGKAELYRKYSKEEAKVMHDKIVRNAIQIDELRTSYGTIRWKQDKAVDDLLRDVFGEKWDVEYTEEEINNILKDENKPTFEKFYENLNGSKVVENDMIKSLRQILERPDNFADLIRPNDTDLVKPIADELYNIQNAGKFKSYDKEGTRMFEPLHNLKVQQSNSIGKDTLGIGAISNTFNAVFNSIGLTLNKEYKPFPKQTRRATILLPHNQEDGAISLSNRFDSLNENNIADVISQLINGWVDVEKDDWISYVQGNKEIAPTLLFLIQAGVPIRQAIYFVSQPLVVRYAQEQRLIKGSFAKALGKPGYNRAKTAAREAIFNDILGDVPKAKEQYEITLQLTSDINNFELNSLERSVKDSANNPNYEIKDFDKAVFLHFLELEDLTQQVDKLQRAFNVDTTTLQDLTEFYGKLQEIFNIRQNTLIPTKYVDAIIKSSVIGTFVVQDFALDIFSKVLPLRNGTIVNNFLHNLDEDQRKAVNSLFKLNNGDDKIRFYQTFKNDLINYIFQNELRNFSPDSFYKNYDVVDSSQEQQGLNSGVKVRDGKLLVDDNKIQQDYDSGLFSTPEYDQPPIESNKAFVNINEYKHFIYEREVLRNLFPFNRVNGNIDYNEYVKENERKDELKKEGETQEVFIKRIEQVSYEEWLRDKALYNTFNPWQLFESKFNVANTYGFIINKYPQLKNYFSILNNIKISTTFLQKYGDETHLFGTKKYINLKLSTSKLTKDEIDVFHENLQNLANASELLKINNINQKSADYISNFFGKLPLYLYLQSGPNARNPFSFARVLPQDKIVRILEKPVKKLTTGIDDGYLTRYLNQFVIANSNKGTRNRFKEYLKTDQKEEPSKQQELTAIPTIEIGNQEDTLETIREEPKIISDDELNNKINQCK